MVLEDEEALAAASAPCAKGLGRPVVIALEPHDILPFSIFASSAYLGLVPGSERRAGLMTSAVFWLPGMRQIYRWTSGASIGKTSFSNELRRGATVCLIPGGVQEVVAIKPEERARGVWCGRRRIRFGARPHDNHVESRLAPPNCWKNTRGGLFARNTRKNAAGGSVVSSSSTSAAARAL